MRWWALLLLLPLFACGRTLTFERATAPPGPQARCGDGVVQAPEACDDGNRVDGDACRASCVSARCGDGVVHVGVEQCDDGNQVETDGCTTRCAPPDCGNGTVQPGEDCDDGNRDDGDACLTSCLAARCGDGFVQRGVEVCDDGNTLEDDDCTSRCEPPRCGDGLVQRGEQCDDANADDGDACLSTCQLARCGDGIVRRGVETCDDGDTDNTDSCTIRCAPPSCGDGFLQPPEACDDGNADDGDACTSSCQPARCGDGLLQRGVEACDDGNQVDDDFCDNACKPPVCGDGKRAGREQCDLGAQNGDRPAFLISQPSGTSIATDALVGNESAAAFYDYFSASSHTGLEVVGESRIYLYIDSNTGALSLVLTHGIDFDTSGLSQPQSRVNFDVTGLPTTTFVELWDDTRSEFDKTGPTTAAGRWSFIRNSDGGILARLPFPGVWRVTVTPFFLQGLTTWGWVRHDRVRLPLVMTEPITIEAFDTATFCRSDCTVPVCGDGRLDGGEVCDDGNTRGGDGCAVDCKSLR